MLCAATAPAPARSGQDEGDPHRAVADRLAAEPAARRQPAAAAVDPVTGRPAAWRQQAARSDAAGEQERREERSDSATQSAFARRAADG